MEDRTFMVCDVCNLEVTELDSRVVPVEEFRELLARGFGIDETNIEMLTSAGLLREQAVTMLAQQYSGMNSDWLLCGKCFAESRALLN